MLIVLSPSAQSAAISIAMPARMSGDSTEPPRSFDGPDDERAVRIAEHDARAHADELVDEEQSRLEHLLVDEHDALALRRRDERDRHRVGRERGPRLVLELGHVSAQVALNDHLLLGRDDEVLPIDDARHAEPREAHQRGAQMLDAGVGDANLRARHRGEADERSDFDVIGPDPMRRAAKLAPAIDRDLVRADAIDLGAERDEEMTEVLHVRLARGVAKDGRSRGRDRGHEGVLGPGDTRLVEEHVGAAKPARREMEAVVEFERRAELLERQKVRVDAPAPDDVAARRRQFDFAAPREHRPGEQDRRANLLAELRIELVGADGLGVNLERVSRAPAHVGARGRHELDQRLDVADARHVFERDRMLGQQRGAHDRQRGVLVS